MSLGLFDVVGPIMHGPSSNHTGGANRIGYLAWRLMGGTPAHITYGFHPIFMRLFTGHRTHVALTAGCLGLREYDPASTAALQTAKERGIQLSYVSVEETDADRNTMRVMGEFDGVSWVINGISPGGGCVVIDRINGMSLHFDGNCFLYYWMADRLAQGQNAVHFLQEIGNPPLQLSRGSWEGKDQLCIQLAEALTQEQEETLAQLLEPSGRLLFRNIQPLHAFAERAGSVPLFNSFADLLSAAETQPLIDLVYQYEENHSGQSREAILEHGLQIVDILNESIQRGLAGDNPLIGGFCSGSDGKMVSQWGKSGQSLTGEVFNEALANSLALAERSASSGRVVAAPTSGAAGTLPGTLFAVAHRCGADRKTLAEAFLVSALLGILIGKDGSFAGSVAGCQVEIGVGAAMAAGASAWLAGGSPEQVVNASVIALANCFGLTCDQPVSPVEVPCIKRNAMGASVALMGAELSLAGVRSAMPADDVVVGFLDIQRRMPEGTKGGCLGGLATAPYAAEMRKKWEEILKQE